MFQYPKSAHEIAIEQLFGVDNCRYTDSKPRLGRLCIMLFTNRCGSNFVADVLASTGRVSQFGEPFNWAFVERAKVRHGYCRFEDFIEALVERKVAPVVGVKASWEQAMMLHRFGILQAMFSDVSWIYVRRRDLCAQAVSFSIANQTGAWTSQKQGLSRDVVFSFDDIENCMRSLATSNARIEEMLASFGYSYHEIVYEDFVQDIDAGAARALEALALGEGRVDREAIRFKRQGTGLNDALSEMYIAELQRRRHLQMRSWKTLWARWKRWCAKSSNA